MQTTQTLQKLYEQDFVAWCEATVAQLKAGQLDHLDIENLIEEIDSLGKRDRRELKNRLIVLLAHLLKRMYVNSPDNFAGWELTIREQRRQINALLTDSPSLKPYLREVLDDIYLDARSDVQLEYANATLPATCPFSVEGDPALLSQVYWPAD
jgi:hypothetical protein